MTKARWKKYKLNQIMEIIGGGTPKTTVPEYWDGDIPWLSVVDFAGRGRWVYETEKNITPEGLKESSTKMLKKGQLIISARGTVGEIAQIGCDMAFNQSCYGLDSKPDIVLNNFLYYLLKFNIQDLKQNTHGAVFDTITRQTFDCIDVDVPPIEEQRAIAKILSDLDEKIELNHRMNKTLEAMGQALFKRWFVDFESTSSFDWQVDELGKYIQFIKGKKPSQISETQLAGYRPQILIDNLNGNSSLYANENKMIAVEIDEPIMVMDGASSGRVEIGHSGILGSTLAKVIVTSDRLSNLFLYYFLKDKEPDINQNTTGTSIPHTDKERIKRYQCNLPSKDLLEKFNEIARRIVNKMITNNCETGFLIQIRDSLLPKLMSGRTRVPINSGVVNGAS